MKAALVKPLIKENTMDCNILNNYIPVSNLTFLYTVIERGIAVHLNKYLINNNINESLQSAYKSDHSTETTLVRMKNDIMMSFDTVDHNVLFYRVKDMLGMSGKILEWFRSYLEQHYPRVVMLPSWIK